MAIPHLAVSDDRIADFCRRWKITEMSVFGSVVRADFRPDSDVDILVSFEPDAGWTLLDLVTIQEEVAVERAIEIIGESARLLSPSFKAQHEEVPWQRIVAPCT